MKKKLFLTKDGSPTFYFEEWNEYYHSKNGAIQESEYVFINNGLDFWSKQKPESKKCNIFEMGLGTALNLFYTAKYSTKKDLYCNYESLEYYPIPLEEIEPFLKHLTFSESERKSFRSIHQSIWNEKVNLTDKFCYTKIQESLLDFSIERNYDLIFFDAFSSHLQPELWDEQILMKLLNSLNPKGVFVTYAAQGFLKRLIKKLGLKLDVLPGAPGKREMVRAVKID